LDSENCSCPLSHKPVQKRFLPLKDLTYRFPLIAEAVARLRARSSIVDGETVCCGDDGVPSFDRIRYRPTTLACSCTPST